MLRASGTESLDLTRPATVVQPQDVAIIGGGFSGVLQAINLLRHEGPRAILIERHDHQLARGVAYSAAHLSHLLNVRAGNMSAFPDDPDHFVRWLAEHGGGNADSFVPRGLYGHYLADLLAEAVRNGRDRIRIVQGDAVDVAWSSSGRATIQLAGGGTVTADRIVLALGNLPPHAPPELDEAALPSGCYAPDPWAGDLAKGLTPADSVLLIGTGLTSVDAALLLNEQGFTGKIIALSRRGLAPRTHDPATPPPVELTDRPPTALPDLVRSVRRRAEGLGWRAAVDELRPMTQMMWAAAPQKVRERFLRHLRPYWDVHRHRLAPQVAARIAHMVSDGKLHFAAGKICGARAVGAAAEIQWRIRGTDTFYTDRFRRIVNCTGPQGDLLRSNEPLLRNLLASKHIRPDKLRLGLDLDSQARVIDAWGRPQEELLAIGPMTRSGLWEIVAVPDLRHQTWSLARRLANAHWVTGEGL